MSGKLSDRCEWGRYTLASSSRYWRCGVCLNEWSPSRPAPDVCPAKRGPRYGSEDNAGKFAVYLTPSQREGLKLILDRWIDDNSGTPWAQTMQEALRIRAQIEPLEASQHCLVRSRF